MKKILSLLLSLCCLCGTAACGRAEPLTELEAIQKRLAEMEGYACTATLTRTALEGTRTYETNQYYRAADGAYRLELLSPAAVAGNYTVFDGERIAQYNPRLDSSLIRDVPESQHRNELFLGAFWENYLQSEGVGVEAAALDESRCIVLEAVIPSSDAALASEKLWVDRESLLPLRFALYDAEGVERYRMEYTAFTFDPQFDDALFAIEAEAAE